jgi:hypothetical protein
MVSSEDMVRTIERIADLLEIRGAVRERVRGDG